MLSGSTSGIGRENANQEFKEFEEKVQETGGGGRGACRRMGVSACGRVGVRVDLVDLVDGVDEVERGELVLLLGLTAGGCRERSRHCF
jgi:hypothetical protein